MRFLENSKHEMYFISIILGYKIIIKSYIKELNQTKANNSNIN